jgi:hypothetical protein
MTPRIVGRLATSTACYRGHWSASICDLALHEANGTVTFTRVVGGLRVAPRPRVQAADDGHDARAIQVHVGHRNSEFARCSELRAEHDVFRDAF